MIDTPLKEGKLFPILKTSVEGAETSSQLGLNRIFLPPRNEGSTFIWDPCKDVD